MVSGPALLAPLTKTSSSSTTMGGVSRFPYPKEVWSPAGGWWAQPKAWKSNTLIAGFGLAVTVAAVWKVSAEKEQRYQQPTRWIPSMMWAKQYKDQQ